VPLTALPQHLEFSSIGHQVHLEQLLSLQLQVTPEAHFHVMILTWRMWVFVSQHSSEIGWSCDEKESSTRPAHWMLAFHL
jgi:hypothetical protein